MIREVSATNDVPVYEATVVTGLESIAAEECIQKLAADKVDKEQGRIIFECSCKESEVLSLKAVDNVNIRVLKAIVDSFPTDKEALLPFFNDILEKCDWNRALSIWKNVFNYEQFDVASILTTTKEEGLNRPAFRVTCNRSGDNHCFNSNDAASIFGGLINDAYHWPVSMKGFDLEVILNIKQDAVSVLISLTRESLCFRNLVSFGPTTLRSTICYNMLRLANIETGDVVYDMMCGSGAITIESALSYTQCFNIASDFHPKAIEHSKSNVDRWTGKRVELMQADVATLPFKDDCIDVFVSDLPFGKRMGSKRENKTLYPILLKETARCARLGTGRAILLTQDKKNMNLALGNFTIKNYWKRQRYIFVKIGGLAAGIYYLQRSLNKYV